MLFLYLSSHSSTCCELNFHFLFNIHFNVAYAVKVLFHVMLLRFEVLHGCGTVSLFAHMSVREMRHTPTSF